MRYQQFTAATKHKSPFRRSPCVTGEAAHQPYFDDAAPTSPQRPRRRVGDGRAERWSSRGDAPAEPASGCNLISKWRQQRHKRVSAAVAETVLGPPGQYWLGSSARGVAIGDPLAYLTSLRTMRPWQGGLLCLSLRSTLDNLACLATWLAFSPTTRRGLGAASPNPCSVQS
jgi:hypothetical protein